MASHFLISTSDVISSFRVEPIGSYTESCSSRLCSVFPSTLIYGAVFFLLPSGNRVVARLSTYVHAIPCVGTRKISKFSLDPEVDIVIEC